MDQETLLQQSEFFDETFTALDARERTFSGKEFNGCTFSGVQFNSSRFPNCKFLDCRFLNCDLSNVSFKTCRLRDLSFVECKLLGINWTELSAAAHLKFQKCVLSFGNFSGMDLRKLVLEACVARELELGHANLAEANCRGTDFAGSRFLQTNLSKADFRQATNYAIRPLDNVLTKAKFSMPDATALIYGLDIVLD